MYCSNCGTQIPDEANICWKCGKPQKESAQAEVAKWETCEITYEAVRDSGWTTSGQARFWAKATGPQGDYRVGESPVFGAWVRKLKAELPKKADSPQDIGYDDYQHAVEALGVLTRKLVEDGWEFVMSLGEGAMYWKKQFRRRVK